MCTPKACLVLSQMRFRHLSFFSSATSSFTLFVDVTLSRFEVQAPLLSLLSPFLASLLAQAGPSPIVSVPFPEHLLRFHLTSFNLSYMRFHSFNSPLSLSLLQFQVPQGTVWCSLPGNGFVLTRSGLGLHSWISGSLKSSDS